MLEHIIIVGNKKEIHELNCKEFSKLYGQRYNITGFRNAKESLDFINKFIDPRGDRLAITISDQQLEDMQGTDFLDILSKTHPLTKKALNTSEGDYEALQKISKKNIQGVSNQNVDELFNVVHQSLKDYETAPSLRHKIEGITFKVADNLYEKKKYFETRLRNYLQAGHMKMESLTPQQQELGLEWDKYDLGGINELVLEPTSPVQYLVAMKKGKCVGGVRIIDGECPMEEGICISDGFNYKKGEKLLLDKIKEQEKYKDTEIYKREISRLVVDKEYRKEGKVLFGLFRIIEELTKDKPTMMCTSRPSQINLYQAIGFERFGPNILYSLEKEWAPLIRRHWYAHNRPEQIEGMCKELHEQVTEPFPLSDIDKWNSYAKSLAKENIKGFYQEKNGI